jgi:hypothetical protein
MNFMQHKKPSLSEHIAALYKERRSSSREHCWYEVITQVDGLPRDTVTLSNLSEHGALMIVTPGTEVPEEFQILGLNKNAIDCRRVWIDGQKVGIAFTSNLDLSGMGKVSSLDYLDQREKLDLN